MRIAILGAGAMGSWFGGMLALQGQDVTLLTTNRPHCEAINERGLILRHESGDQTVAVAAMDPTDFTTPAELIILFTKSFQSDAALSSIATILDQNTYILTLQNGLGGSEIIARYIPLERVLLGVTMMPVDKIGPGIVAAKGQGTSYFNSATNPQLPMCRRLEEIFSEAGLDIRLDPDIHRRIWSKVAFNAGMNAVSALAQGTPGTIGDSPGAQDLVNRVAREVAEVAAAQGVEIDLNEVHNTIDYACKHHRDHKPSMQQDLAAGRRTEVDALNGAIVRLGASCGVPTPLNEMLETLVRVAELSHQRYR